MILIKLDVRIDLDCPIFGKFRPGQRFQATKTCRSEIPGNAVHAQRIGSVGGDGNIHHRVGLTKDFCSIHARLPVI